MVQFAIRGCLSITDISSFMLQYSYTCLLSKLNSEKCLQPPYSRNLWNVSSHAQIKRSMEKISPTCINSMSTLELPRWLFLNETQWSSHSCMHMQSTQAGRQQERK